MLEEMRSTNEELAETQSQLRLSNDRLIESEDRIRSIFEQFTLIVKHYPEFIVGTGYTCSVNIIEPLIYWLTF